jgi:DNA-binding beta-propeller fold protein YncE
MRGLVGAFIIASITAPAVWSGDLTGPVSGYVVQNSSQLRPVLGIPGASLLGPAIDVGFEAVLITVAPGQPFALAVSSDGRLHALQPSGVAWASRPVSTLHGAPSRVVFSPSGRAALLLNESTLDVLTGLPARLDVIRTLALPESGVPAALAVSDDGNVAIAAAGDNVYAAGVSAEWKLMATTGPGLVAAFAPESHDAALASPQSNTVSLFRAVSEGGETVHLAGADEGISNPVGVAFSPDGRRVIVTNAGNSSVLLIRPGEESAILRCSCIPTGLAAMGAYYRLNEVSEGPIWLLDLGPDRPRLVFVPAPVSAN